MNQYEVKCSECGSPLSFSVDFTEPWKILSFRVSPCSTCHSKQSVEVDEELSSLEDEKVELAARIAVLEDEHTRLSEECDSLRNSIEERR